MTLLGLTAADAVINKKVLGLEVHPGMLILHPLGLGKQTALIFLYEEMDDIMKIFKSLEESGLSIKGVTENIQDEGKEQKRGFLNMLLGTLCASLLGNLVTGKVLKAKISGQGGIRAGEEAITANWGRATIWAGQKF